MGIIVGLPCSGGSEKDLQLNFGKVMAQQTEMRAPFLPAEWYPQSGVQLTWPHAGTDWAYMLDEVQECFVNIANEIAKRGVVTDCNARTGRSEEADRCYCEYGECTLSEVWYK